MRKFLAAVLLAGTALVAAPALGQAVPPPAPQPGDGPEDARLKQLFHDSDEANLKRNPIEGIFRGDLRYAAHLGDYLTEAHYAAEQKIGRAHV